MDKKKQSVSLLLSRFRGWIQAAATLLTNIHLPNFFKGGIYQGKGKSVCVPGLNCYSCPAASGACPIGAFQAVAGSSKFRFSYYITGILILLGVLLGRFICGFLCPFGWLQELLHKIPGKKLSTKKLRRLTYLKYVILLLAVVLLPALIVNDVGMGDPYFCKYICPQGVLEGAIPLAAANESIRAALGALFTRKLIILIAVVVLSVLFFRPFCKWICPLGAFYALMNKVSLLGIQVDTSKCVSCGKCARTCQMDVDITKSPNDTECIPVIHDPAAAEAVNAAARETGTLVIVKPHPAQDLAHIRALELSNLRFIDDGLFAAHGITSYEFLACTDALITDYSSVLFDYLLTGKPVGLTFEDIDAYARQPGFAIDPQPLRESAAMLDTPDDFRTFFAQLAAGDDPLRAKRLQLTKLTNQYTDGHSAERVAAFLAERLREREHT